MKPHKHAELIKAWADGAEIEVYSPWAKTWRDATTPSWDGVNEYRIKPEPKPVEFVWDFHCRIFMKDNGDGTYEFIKAEKIPEVLK